MRRGGGYGARRGRLRRGNGERRRIGRVKSVAPIPAHIIAGRVMTTPRIKRRIGAADGSVPSDTISLLARREGG